MPALHTTCLVDFYPRPPRGGRPALAAWPDNAHKDFYPRPPRGGRPATMVPGKESFIFLSTPSARRATAGLCPTLHRNADFYPRPPRGGRPLHCSMPGAGTRNFYPRPPRGGRLFRAVGAMRLDDFYPRPPRGGRRAIIGANYKNLNDFYPRPPRGGRPRAVVFCTVAMRISIHALREEGDLMRWISI